MNKINEEIDEKEVRSLELAELIEEAEFDECESLVLNYLIDPFREIIYL